MPIRGGTKGGKGEREGEGERGEFPDVNTYAQGTTVPCHTMPE